MLNRTLLPTLVCLFASSIGSAQPAPSPQNPIDYATARFDRNLPARRTAATITVDGRLDEEAWATAEIATNFIQVQPQTGQPAVDQT
jgi:hypothetical protein